MLKYYYKIIQLLETVLNILMVTILNVRYLFRKTRYPKRKYDSIQVLGNGPSLKDDIPKILARRNNTAVMVVNTFATTDLFEQLKPEYYILVDPAFFSPPKKERIQKIQETTSNALIEKTKWEMNLFVPYSSKKSFFIEKIKKGNKFIKIISFKNIPVIGGANKLNSSFFKYSLANPLFQNVLIAGLFTSLKMQFKTIILWGADHSWHENFKLSDENFIYTPDKHFFDNSSEVKYFMHTHPDGSPKKVHEEFFTVARAFSVYHSIAHFSETINCKVINLSSKSWIDAFNRKL